MNSVKVVIGCAPQYRLQTENLHAFRLHERRCPVGGSKLGMMHIYMNRQERIGEHRGIEVYFKIWTAVENAN